MVYVRVLPLWHFWGPPSVKADYGHCILEIVLVGCLADDSNSKIAVKDAVLDFYNKLYLLCQPACQLTGNHAVLESLCTMHFNHMVQRDCSAVDRVEIAFDLVNYVTETIN